MNICKTRTYVRPHHVISTHQHVHTGKRHKTYHEWRGHQKVFVRPLQTAPSALCWTSGNGKEQVTTNALMRSVCVYHASAFIHVSDRQPSSPCNLHSYMSHSKFNIDVQYRISATSTSIHSPPDYFAMVSFKKYRKIHLSEDVSSSAWLNSCINKLVIKLMKNMLLLLH